MEEFKPNSHKFKEEEKLKAEREKKEKVVSGNVKTKKKKDISKFTDIFISEDAANVKSYILMDVLVPAIKKAVSDIIKDGIDMILYGESGSRRRGTNNASYISYNKYSERDRDYDRRYNDRPRSSYGYNDIVLENRGDAEAIMDRMDEVLDQYKMVSIADLYEFAGLRANYTDQKYGWTNLSNARIERTRDGYWLKLPKAMPFD